MAVQPPVCSHSYLHVAASDPEKSQSISSIPLAFRLCKKRRRRVVHLQPRGIRGWGGPSLGWLLLPCRKDPNWWRQRRSPSFVSNPYVVPTSCALNKIGQRLGNRFQVVDISQLDPCNSDCGSILEFLRENGPKVQVFSHFIPQNWALSQLYSDPSEMSRCLLD